MVVILIAGATAFGSYYQTTFKTEAEASAYSASYVAPSKGEIEIIRVLTSEDDDYYWVWFSYQLEFTDRTVIEGGYMPIAKPLPNANQVKQLVKDEVDRLYDQKFKQAPNAQIELEDTKYLTKFQPNAQVGIGL